MACPSRARLIPVLLLPLLAGAGCGGGNPPSVSLDEYLSRGTAALCKFSVACGQTPDVATCLASQQLGPAYLATVYADIRSGKLGYDGAKARNCVEWFERVYGATACTQSALAALDTQGFEGACAEVFTGTVAPGGDCLYPEQCVGRGFCQQTDPTCSLTMQCCPGTCAAKPASIPVGGDCSGLLPFQTCADGATCGAATVGAPLTCLVPSKVEGTACGSFGACASPLYCVLDATIPMGTCRRTAATGAPCDTDGPLLACDDLTDYCDQTTGTCMPRVAAGGTCDPAQSNCIGYAACEGTTCVAELPPGAACSPTSGPGCLGDLECSAQNTCALVPEAAACP